MGHAGVLWSALETARKKLVELTPNAEAPAAGAYRSTVTWVLTGLGAGPNGSLSEDERAVILRAVHYGLEDAFGAQYHDVVEPSILARRDSV